MKNTLAPMCLFVYNRPAHTQKTIDSLLTNELAKESHLFIFADGPKNEADRAKVEGVRVIASDIRGFRKVTIFKSSTNKGLSNSIIAGVTKIVKAFGKVIVLEDDLELSPYFLQFMNDGLNRFEKDSRVASIHGFVDSNWEHNKNFFLKGADCWGWGTWSDRWKLFEPDASKLYKEVEKRKLSNAFDRNGISPNMAMLKKQSVGEIDSWAIRWHASMFLQEKLTLYPHHSLVRNSGHDGSGTHGSSNNKLLRQKVWLKPVAISPIPIKETKLSPLRVKIRNMLGTVV